VSAVAYLLGLAVVAGVAWFISSPLLGVVAVARARIATDPERYRLEKEKDLAYAAIKEAEFDFQMGKLSPEDYASLRAKYESRALAAIAALDRVAGGSA
jgi:hypothetical protein